MITFSCLVQVAFVLIGVALYTLLERKILGYQQRRKGPNKPGLLGIFVPFADALKLFSKEIPAPYRRNKVVFTLIPLLSLGLPLGIWVIYPSEYYVLSLKFSCLYFLCVSAVGVYAILGAGWRRNRSYSIIGAVRSVAQSVSYEVRLSLIIIHFVAFYYYSFYVVKLSPLWIFIFVVIILLFVSALAETNRTPFDFSEGESELVSGFNTEFGSVSFVMIFLAEYLSIVFLSVVIGALFNIRSFADLYGFIILWASAFIWARGTLPRFRYDQLMYLAWKTLLPFALCRASLYFVL